MQEVVISMILVGAVIGVLLSGMLSERFGCCRFICAVVVIFAVGVVGVVVVLDVPVLIAACFVLGLAVGAAAGMVPVYIAELAPVRIRGGLMVFFQLMVAV